MHKYVVPSNYKVRNYIPDDLAFSILSKLPLKSLKRFGSICKSWSLLFENSNFMNMYRINFLSKNHAFYEDTSLLLFEVKGRDYYETKCDLYSIPGDRFENKIKLDWPNPFQGDDDIGFYILDYRSINGILCLQSLFESDLILWNLATKEFKIIPKSPIESKPDPSFENRIFGYDSVRDDYKVIQCAKYGDFNGKPMRESYEVLWEIYSLRSNTWKKLDDGVPECSLDCIPIFLDGVGHLWTKLETDNEASLVSFDFSNEIFFTTSIPSEIFGKGWGWRDLLVLNGSISLIVQESNGFEVLHISILGEVGVRDSWTKLFIIDILNCIPSAIGAWKNGDMFFRKDDGELVLFDLSTNMIKELGIKTKKRKSNSRIIIYKESYVPIGEISD